VHDAAVLAQLAEVWAGLEQYDEAEACLQRACLVRPDDAAAQLCWARLLAQRGDRDGARRLGRRAAALDRSPVAPLLFLVRLALDDDDWPEAERMIARLHRVPTAGRLPLAWRAEWHRRRGEAEAAKETALSALRLTAPTAGDAGVDVALGVLREVRASLQRCQNFQLEIGGLLGERAYFRAYSVLARDRAHAVAAAEELEAALTPGPWRLHRLEEFEHDAPALEGVYWLSLRPALLDRSEFDFGLRPLESVSE